MMQIIDTLQTGDNIFVSLLQEKFGSNLGFENEGETKSFIAKCKSFYSAVKDAHRGQLRQDGGTYFGDHVKPVAEIVLSFPDATIWDVVVALGHDFVEDHRELSFEQSLQHIETTRGPTRGPMLRKRINNLTKYDLETYMTGDIAAVYNDMDEGAKLEFLTKNKKELGIIRGRKYFENLEQHGLDGELRVKVADSVHNLLSCIHLGVDKIEKTISEKEQYLLPLVKARSMHHEANILEGAIALVKLVLVKQKMSQSEFDVMTQLIPSGFRDELAVVLLGSSA